jgi:hypothetical protein
VTDAAYTYLSWARSGVAASLPAPTGTVFAAPASATLAVGVTVGVNTGNPQAATASAQLLGPGDVTALDPRQIVRTDPTDGEQSFAPNLFPCIEFDRPDLPWAFTPLGATGERAAPWIVLVTVPEKSATFTPAAGGSLATLAVDASELPDPSDSWAWAYVAVTAPKASLLDSNGVLEDVMTLPADQVISRLVCPRRLDGDTVYIAAVVPAFETGRLAALRQTGAPTTLTPAWSTGQVTLPAYFSWRFHTGQVGDFRSLALQMQRRSLDASVSTRPIDVSHPGAGVPDAPDGTTLGLEGALRVPGAASTDWPDAVRTPFQDALEPLLNAGAQTAGGGGHVLAPPLYGRWLAAHRTVPAAGGGQPVWLRTLNLDPRPRAVAGIAARTVQRHVQTLLAQAWQQIDQVNAANALLRGAQLARTRAGRAWDRLGAVQSPVLAQLAGPALARIRTGTLTAHGRVSQSSYPAGALTGAARRLSRPRGPLGRRLGLAPGALAQAATTPPPAGAVPPWATWHGPRRTGAELSAAPVLDGFTLLGPNDPAPEHPHDPKLVRPGDSIAEGLRGAAIVLADAAANLAKSTALPPLDLASLAADVHAALDPETTVLARIGARIALPTRPADPLDPILAAPTFPQPMWETLQETSRELLFPGLAQIPHDTATALETNPRFVEAFMVGLNHEIGAQLLWAEYPTDQRGTCFRQFWDARGRIPAPATPADGEDIDPIPGWLATSDLGDSLKATATGNAVLVLRGELLRRYPDTTVYAIPATGTTRPRTPVTDETQERYPVFSGRLADVTFFGFDLTADEARGSLADGKPGWFFVLQQHPTAPHYGLAADTVGDTAQPPGSWDEVSWGNLSPDADHPPTYVPLTPQVPWFTGYSWPTDGQWGADSASMAVLSLRRPVRVAIHAEDLLPA